ncbi:MAG: hypothetical protein Q8O63_03125 [Hoeflea sp.]|nr:hypothetical protein [Hoeflea sp.]
MAPRKPSDAEYRFKIDAYSPDTIPMSRLAEYMGELAAILGEQKSVHFERLEPGSTIIVHKVEREAVPKVRERTAAVRQNSGPTEALRAYKAVNRLLRDDNAIGVLQEKKGVVIRFPGRDEVEEKYPTIRQQGTLDGVVVSVGGADKTVHVRLLSEGDPVAGLYTTNRQLGKELAGRFDENVRLIGMGSWTRDGEGKWTLENFRIDAFEDLKPLSLTDALSELKKLRISFDDSAYDELNVIRHGPESDSNGGH